MVCDEEGVGGSRSKSGAMGTPCVIASTLMMLIATVVSEAGRCILAISLQGKLLLTKLDGSKVSSVSLEAIFPTSIALWRINPNDVASGRSFAVRIHATSFGPLINDE